MAVVTWCNAALGDLDDIRRSIAEDAPRSATVVIGRVFHAVERLDLFPLSGRIAPEFEGMLLARSSFGTIG